MQDFQLFSNLHAKTKGIWGCFFVFVCSFFGGLFIWFLLFCFVFVFAGFFDFVFSIYPHMQLFGEQRASPSYILSESGLNDLCGSLQVQGILRCYILPKFFT